MNYKAHIQQLVQQLHPGGAAELQYDADAIAAAYQKNESNQSLSIKILSVAGGFLASIFFTGFLMIAGLYQSGIGLLVMGTIFVATALGINRAFDKIIMDTMSVSFYVIGFLLLGIGCSELDVKDNFISILFLAIALTTLAIIHTYILTFVAVLIINGSLFSLLLINDIPNLVHLHIALLTLVLMYLFLQEAKIITTNPPLSKRYNPVTTGLMLSFLTGLIFAGKKGILPISPQYLWLSSVPIITAILFLAGKLFHKMGIIDSPKKNALYLLITLTLLPTVLAPAIPGALLVMLLCFWVNYKTGLATGIIAFIYFISQYYYDLKFTLFTKSVLLFASGLFFLAIYWFTHKRLTPDEKI